MDNKLVSTFKAHDGGFISALRYLNGYLFSGGKDGNIVITKVADLTQAKKVNVGAVVRAVDGNFSAGVFTAGLLNGKIIKHDFNKNTTKVI